MTAEVDLNKMTRKHNIGMDGQKCHGRNHTQVLDFTHINYEQIKTNNGNGNYPCIGFGFDNP